MAVNSGTRVDSEYTHDTSEPRLSRQPNSRFFSIEYYAHGRPAPKNPSHVLAKWLNEKVGEPKWRFSEEKHPKGYRAHKDIFVARVRCELALNYGNHATNADNDDDSDDDGDYRDIQAIVRSEVPDSFKEKGSLPLFVLFSSRGSDTTLESRYTGAELLKKYVVTPEEDKIAKGDPSLSDALWEVGSTVTGISLTVYALYQGWLKVVMLKKMLTESSPPTASSKTDCPKQPSQPASSTPPPPPPEEAGYTETVRETLRNMRGWVDVTGTLASFLNQISTAPKKQDKLKSIADGRGRLLQSSSQLKVEFRNMTTKMQTLFPSEKTTAPNLSREDILDLMQLLAGMSNSELTNKCTLDQLVPLVQKEYSDQKKWCYRGAAFCGAVAIVYVVAPFFGVPVWGAAWFVSHKSASIAIGLGSVAVTCESNKRQKTNAKQVERCNDVCNAYSMFVTDKTRLFSWLLANLIGNEHRKNLDPTYKVEIYNKTGVQVDMLEEKDYAPAGLKTAWDALANATGWYIEKCEELAKNA
ncbi:hypothetical protein BDW71DRAFT_211896 [Aspergillus fruticulosus]